MPCLSSAQRPHDDDRQNQTNRFIKCLALCVSLLIVMSCTEAELYHSTEPPLNADRVTLNGRICTEDPEVGRFPARLIIMVDQGQGALYSEYDPAQLRLQALNSLVQNALSKPEFSLAIIGYAGRARRLAPEEDVFTRNPGELLNAITQLSLPGNCLLGEICRDYQSGLDAVETLIEDDLTLMEAGQRAMTQYTVLWVAAGPQSPIALNRDCCPRGDRTCRRAEGADRPSPTCQAQLDLAKVQDIRKGALASGAGGFQLHVLHLASEEQATNRQMAQLFEQLTFAGSGRYARFGAAANIDMRAVSVFDRPSDLEAAQVVIVNQSAAPRLAGLLADSDRDGLADSEEDLNGNGVVDEGESDPLLGDSDGDGISDLIEARVGFVNGEIDEPEVCEELFILGDLARADRDFDGLNECEERLMGTDPSLSDSDGDNLPDGVELRRGTDHLNPDSAEDFDEDGVSNGDEIKEGTDPRSIDEAQRLGLAARYTITREGRIRELNADTLNRLEGVRITSVSTELSAGLAAVQWNPTPDNPEQRGTLSFKSPQNNELGGALPITTSGRYRVYGDLVEAPRPQVEAEPMMGDEQVLPSSVEEEVELVQWVEVEINASVLPEVRFTEEVLIRERERSCLSYTVRNLRMIETQPNERDQREGRVVGANDMLIYFAQKPSGQSEVPGRFRVARVPIYYQAPDRRSPSGSSLLIEEAEFVSPQFSVQIDVAASESPANDEEDANEATEQ
jgi:hypothetical protein